MRSVDYYREARLEIQLRLRPCSWLPGEGLMTPWGTTGSRLRNAALSYIFTINHMFHVTKHRLVVVAKQN